MSVSSTEDDCIDRWQNSKHKTFTMGFFSRHVSDKARRREALVSFMNSMKTQKQEDNQELCERLAEYSISDPSSITTRRPKSPERNNRIPCPEGLPYKYKGGIPPNSKCGLCQDIFPLFREQEAVPCRICDDVFHKDCLMKCGDLTDADRHNINKARSNIGWSCPYCANISLLLTTDEVKQMTYMFDVIDFNQDIQITLQEYLHYYTRRSSLTNQRGQLLPAEKERLTRTFKYMDLNKDGKLDWWEFVNYESKYLLAKKNKYDLVDLLTTKELCAARETFNSMDRDGDGTILEYEVKAAYRNWYRQFEKHKPITATEEVKDSDILDLHANVLSQMIMESNDNRRKDMVKWEDFILDQALYILCSRPNISI